ncbi:hypothetical protein ELI_2615 [Eubacterium callanderi]|uniref:Uncharacterized protein n=1 Tax=Eubacterium callanderi TaxID=53442 RepID=E3GNA1_9FIRM|nr:hypothetical protein ELI_2615 [Eubacterium callanderi]
MQIHFSKKLLANRKHAILIIKQTIVIIDLFTKSNVFLPK